MSTPSGKPFDPCDLSAYAPRRARERANQEPESDSAVLLPYAPRAAHQQSTASERAADLDDQGHIDSESDHEPEIADELVSEGNSAATISDDDLERLESSLEWLKREADRLPRASQMPPVSGLRPVDPDDQSRTSERYINGFRVPPSLAPNVLQPPLPPLGAERDHLRGAFRLLIAAAVAAPVAYYFAVGGKVKEPEPVRGPELASFEGKSIPLTSTPANEPTLPPLESRDDNSAAYHGDTILPAAPSASPTAARQNLAAVTPEPSRASAPTAPSTPRQANPTASPELKTASAPPPPSPPNEALAAPSAAPGRTAAPSVRKLDPEQTKLLMKQGEEFVAAGDLITARLVFQRAAEAGDASGALAMGATYDPIVQAKLGVRGIGSDVETARRWYEKARDYGSPDAARRLELLAGR
jgi:hypothetical protein